MRVLMLALLVGGCATTAPRSSAEAFFARLQGLCGKAYEGRVVSTDAADADMRGKRLVMHVRECTADVVRIPFHVGEDRSRTWVVTADKIVTTERSQSDPPQWLLLKHVHRHADGTADVLTNYGGQSYGGTALRHDFPADSFSQDLFRTHGNPASATNVWTIEIEPARSFAYQLRRPGRFFRVEFDLSRPVPAPPPPWGTR